MPHSQLRQEVRKAAQAWLDAELIDPHSKRRVENCLDTQLIWDTTPFTQREARRFRLFLEHPGARDWTMNLFLLALLAPPPGSASPARIREAVIDGTSRQ